MKNMAALKVNLPEGRLCGLLIMMQKYPIVKHNEVYKYCFEHVLKVITIDKSAKSLESQLSHYIDQVRADSDRNIPVDYDISQKSFDKSIS